MIYVFTVYPRLDLKGPAPPVRLHQCISDTVRIENKTKKESRVKIALWSNGLFTQPT